MAEHQETDPSTLTDAADLQPLEKPDPDPGPSEPGCYICAHRVWAVALGIGVLCRHPANAVADHPVRVPGRWHICDHFERGPGYVGPPLLIVRRPDEI